MTDPAAARAGRRNARALSVTELRERQLRILDVLAEHCRTHELTFYLCAGTLLGAVRHAGYIPWDDDIDVMLPRRDYERLCASFEAASGSVNMMSLRSTATSRSYPLPFAKICDDSTLIDVESDIVRGIGVYVDVFPLDGWCQSSPARQAQRISIALLTTAMRAKHLQLGRARRGARNAVLRVAKAILAPIGPRQLANALSWTATRATFESSETAGVIVWGYHEQVPRNAYGRPVPVRFENRACPAPADSDAVLRILYGDYRTLPPEADRVTHHRFRAYAFE